MSISLDLPPYPRLSRRREQDSLRSMKALGPTWTRSSIAGLLVLLTGCSTTTILKYRNGYDWEGQVVGGDDEHVYIQGRHRVEAISREDIEDIDYPGNVAATIGVLLMLYGFANIAVGLGHCGQKDSSYCAGVFAPAAVGVGLWAYGGLVHMNAVATTKKPLPSAISRLSLRWSVSTYEDGATQSIRPTLCVGSRF